MPTVLLCDDATGFRLMLGMTLRDAGWEVVEAESWPVAVAAAAEHQPAAVLADLWMPNPDMESLAALRAAVPAARLAVMSSLSVEDAAALVAGVPGVDVVLSKRRPPAELVSALGAPG